MPEIGDGLWVTIGARIDGLQKGLADAKGSLTEWRDATNANSRLLGTLEQGARRNRNLYFWSQF